jgi:hypothetical protein
MKPEKVAQVLTQLHGAGLLDKTETGFTPHNWKGRQYKSDVSTERVKRFRETKRNVSSTVSETPPEQKQNTEQSRAEQTRAAVSNSEKVLRTDLAEAFGPSKTPDLSRAGVWLSKGYSATMIVEVVREVLARGVSVASLNYFDTILAERHATRQETPSERATASDKIDMEKVVQLFAKTGVWSRYAGPEPGLTGCRAPPEMLEKYGIVAATGARTAPPLRRMDA